MMAHRKHRSLQQVTTWNRRTVLQVTAAGTASVAYFMAVGPHGMTQAQDATPLARLRAAQVAYVGSDSRTAIKAGADPSDVGISVFAVDPDTGALTHVQTVPSDNAFYFAFDP